MPLGLRIEAMQHYNTSVFFSIQASKRKDKTSNTLLSTPENYFKTIDKPVIKNNLTSLLQMCLGTLKCELQYGSLSGKVI